MTPQQAEMICHTDVLQALVRGTIWVGICLTALLAILVLWTNRR